MSQVKGRTIRGRSPGVKDVLYLGGRVRGEGGEETRTGSTRGTGSLSDTRTDEDW